MKQAAARPLLEQTYRVPVRVVMLGHALIAAPDAESAKEQAATDHYALTEYSDVESVTVTGEPEVIA